ncbi:MAG: MerR family transcriptional regulator [Lachnospiraceae bacterium]|nr:MerR family transcriptional regulator [Lachnospiraceae bacterium]
MKINEVETRVGITKKNIRFYEEKGLVSPKRDETNGYREYSEEDVMVLQKVKLLRQLSVPIDEILKLEKGYFTLEDCMHRHIILLDRETENISQNRQICAKIVEDGEQFSNMNTEKYLLMMDLMEKEGVRFMNVQDVDKKRRGSILSTVVMIVLMGAMIALFVWAQMVDPIPFPIIGILIAMPAAVIIGVLIALKQRMKQIEGGEEDEARKY